MNNLLTLFFNTVLTVWIGRAFIKTIWQVIADLRDKDYQEMLRKYKTRRRQLYATKLRESSIKNSVRKVYRDDSMAGPYFMVPVGTGSRHHRRYRRNNRGRSKNEGRGR